MAQEAVQVDGDQQLGPDPTRLGQPAGFQVAAGQLGQGISPALATTAGVVGVGRAGQRLQGGQHDLAGLGLQQSLQGDHALQGGRHPQPPAQVLPLGLALGTLGVSGRQEMAHDPPQPGRVQPPGRRHQHRFGLGGQVVGELLGAVSQHLGMGERQLPVDQRLGGLRSGGHRTGPGRSAPAMAAAPAPIRSRARSHPAVEPA